MDKLSLEFKDLYDQWRDAIANKNWGWFDIHLTDDMTVSAHPWPTLKLNKQQFIELDQQMEEIDAEWIHVSAYQVGTTVITCSVARFIVEKFKDGTFVSEGMPSGKDLGSLVKGKTVAYTGAWKKSGDVWQIYDHHMVGVVEGFAA